MKKSTIDRFSFLHSFLHCHLVLAWLGIARCCYCCFSDDLLSSTNDRLFNFNLSYNFRVVFFVALRFSFYGEFMTHMTSDIQLMTFDMSFEYNQYTTTWTRMVTQTGRREFRPQLLTIVSHLILNDSPKIIWQIFTT